jgi:hypothetical protein
MISPNEIRIGNLLRWKDNGQQFDVMMANMADHHFWEHIGHGDIEGIPLSADIMAKCGFHLDANLSYNGLRLSLKFVRWEPTIPFLQVDSPFGSTTLKFVHDLQNWFFALTEQELNVNL